MKFETAKLILAEAKDKLAQALDLKDLATACGAKEITQKLEKNVLEIRELIRFWQAQITPESEDDAIS